jgi:hypothetical protein
MATFRRFDLNDDGVIDDHVDPLLAIASPL